jgi:hypothetical protein
MCAVYAGITADAGARFIRRFLFEVIKALRVRQHRSYHRHNICSAGRDCRLCRLKVKAADHPYGYF